MNKKIDIQINYISNNKVVYYEEFINDGFKEKDTLTFFFKKIKNWKWKMEKENEFRSNRIGQDGKYKSDKKL